MPAYVDNTPPSTPTLTSAGANFTVATATPVVTVSATDSGGIYSIKLEGGVSYSSTNYVSGIQTTASNQFPDSGTLDDGSYTATVTDLAGNSAVASFQIDTAGPATSPKPRGPAGPSGGGISVGMCVVFIATTTPNGPGIKTIWTSVGGSASFPEGTNPAVYPTAYCPTSSGTITVWSMTWAGVVSTETVVVSSGALDMVISGSGSGWSDSSSVFVGDVPHPVQFTAHFDWADCTTFQVMANGKTLSCVQGCGGCAIDYVSDWYGVPAPSYSWSVRNVSVSSFTGHSIVLKSEYSGLRAFLTTPDTLEIVPGGGVEGTVFVPELQTTTFTYVLYASTLTAYSPYSGVTLSTTADLTVEQQSSMIRKVLRHSGSEYILASADGGVAVFDSTMSLNFQYDDSSIDTATARIYSFGEVDWDSGAISGQDISVSTAGVVTAIGMSTHTALFAVFYDGQDSSAPVTTFSLQGSSYSFGGTMFVSTDTFLVLTATDPVVNGFDSTVATITYRFDPTSSTAFSVYTASIPVTLGTHIFQYRSYDYAGNAEEIKTATFTVTAGSVFRATSDDQALGGLLVGFLGSGAEAEVVARAQDSTTLLVSSANLDAMLGVTNIGSVGVGVADPQAQLDIGRAAVALQLRSGDTVSTGTSVQAAFGYNGDVAMRHAIRTVHGAATEDNRMDFLVWSPDAGSTTTIAARDVMSLQGSTIAHSGAMHVLPVGTPDVELEVSNGVTTGGGTMERLQWMMPSSRRFKSDIRYLKEKDEDRALDETAKLNHVRFRYKSRAKDGRLADDPSQQVRTGLVYEEAPAVLKDGKGAVLTNERLASVELALRSAMRRLEALEKRYAALKARRKKP